MFCNLTVDVNRHTSWFIVSITTTACGAPYLTVLRARLLCQHYVLVCIVNSWWNRPYACKAYTQGLCVKTAQSRKQVQLCWCAKFDGRWEMNCTFHWISNSWARPASSFRRCSVLNFWSGQVVLRSNGSPRVYRCSTYSLVATRVWCGARLSDSAPLWDTVRLCPRHTIPKRRINTSSGNFNITLHLEDIQRRPFDRFCVVDMCDCHIFVTLHTVWQTNIERERDIRERKWSSG